MKTIAIIILLLMNSISLPAQEKEEEKEKVQFRYQPNEAFGFGEKLEYKVGYKFITAGTGSFHIMPKPVKVKGRSCYDIRFNVRSLESLEFLYKVKDQYRTILDVGGIFPWQFEQHIREGNYKRDFSARFDHEKELATVRRKKKGDTSYTVPKYVHDIVSAFYYVRTLDLSSMKKDSIIYLKNFFKDTTYNLGVKILGKQEVEVEAGKFKTIVVQPMVVEGGLFKSEGEIFIWLTDDDRKIPVKVATKIIIGYVGAELTKYSGLRGPLEGKIKEDEDD